MVWEESVVSPTRYEYIAQVDAERRAAIKAQVAGHPTLEPLRPDQEAVLFEPLDVLLTVEHFDKIVSRWVACQQMASSSPLVTPENGGHDIAVPRPSPSSPWLSGQDKGWQALERHSSTEEVDVNKDQALNKYEEIALEDAERRLSLQVGEGPSWTIGCLCPDSSSPPPQPYLVDEDFADFDQLVDESLAT